MADAADRVLDAVAAAAPDVRAALPGRRERTGAENPTGDERLAADAYADDLLTDRVAALDGVGEVASEEREAVTDAGTGDLAVALDPLDGSSNLRSNNLMGTVVSVYDDPLPAGGDALRAAGYVLYGPTTTMTVARDGAATEYLVTDGGREAVREVTLPDDPTVYGFGGRRPDWPDDFAAFAAGVEGDESIKLRYGGAMVGDVNQVLTYGGVFAYPALRSAPAGKLRRQFEAIPVAAIVEAAGGASSDGRRSLLDRTPDELHERVPVHVGNAGLVDRLEAALD